MIFWIGEATGISSAELLEPLIRDAVQGKYEANLERINKLKAAAAELERIKNEPTATPAEEPIKKKPRG
jgi:hypothetical protein